MEYLFTERAHLMCPHMCFAIAAQLPREFDPARIQKTVDVLAEAHPFLRALLGYEEASDAYFYRITDRSQTEILIKTEKISGLEAPEILKEYEEITNRDFDLFSEGMLKAAAWEAGKMTVFLLVFHHLLADGRGALSLVEELADHYVSGKKPAFVQEKLISSKADLPKGSGLPWISRILVRRANRQWKKEAVRLSYGSYHALADEFLSGDPVDHACSSVEKDELSAILEQCHASHVTVNDYLLARLLMEENAEKVIIASDLRDRLDCYQKGALGNYSTAFSVTVRKKAGDLFALAGQMHEAIQKIMRDPSRLCLVLQCYADLEPGLLDAAFMAARGRFKSKAAKFIGTMFFGFGDPTGYSITNLGRIESAVIEDAFFLPPASFAIKKTLGVLTVNGRMHICTSSRERSGTRSGPFVV